MSLLHDIPRERLILSEKDIRGLRYLRSLGYVRFRIKGNGLFDIQSDYVNWLHQVIASDYANWEDRGYVPEFDWKWIVP